MNNGLYGFPVQSFATTSSTSSVLSTYDPYKIIHFDVSTYSGSGDVLDVKNPGTVSTALTSGLSYSSTDRAIAFTGASSTGGIMEGTNATNFSCAYPFYIAVFKAGGYGPIVVKNNSSSDGAVVSGRYLMLYSNGNFRNRDADSTDLTNSLATDNNWAVLVYARMADQSSVQYKRHFANTFSSTVESQSTFNWTARNDKFMLASAFSSYAERTACSIREIILYKTDSLTDAQRNELINNAFYSVKAKWAL